MFHSLGLQPHQNNPAPPQNVRTGFLRKPTFEGSWEEIYGGDKCLILKVLI